MYHKVLSADGSAELFRKHIDYLANCYPFSSPGDRCASGNNICLIFDDAYIDFYHVVYPLLQQYQIPAVVAVSAGAILEKSNMDISQRLALLNSNQLHHESSYDSNVFCDWQELHEMTQSGLVQAASHGYHHANLAETGNCEREIILSKTLIEAKLDKPVLSYVYPYGRTNAAVQKFVSQHYRFAFRIGAALNRNWEHPNGLYYRFDADPLWMNSKKISKKMILRGYFKYLLNLARKK
ncbi:MAG: polysaccharide deacetylase family protein [Gammaproteobacteria bacterium]|nr:polysaccharide deacetylase family protein [Gammaproteobacteria bacterium]